MEMTDPNNSSSAPVRLKGMGDGLCVILDPDQPRDFIRSELIRLFQPLKHLAINARVILDFGEAEGDDALVDELGTFLKRQFGVGSVNRSAKRRPPSEDVLRQRDMDRSFHHYRSDVLMLTGRVRSGQKVTARKHLLILGDVNPGGEAVAGGDILIMGGLAGTAIAGQPDGPDAIVLALDFRPTQIQIASVVAAGLPPSRRRYPEYAYVEGGNIVVENYMEANPFGRMPWPEVR
jgi:septum site-determining protein MinC